MRDHLIKVVSEMCRQQELEWQVFDLFINETDWNMGDADLLTELILISGIDYIRIIRKAMGL